MAITFKLTCNGIARFSSLYPLYSGNHNTSQMCLTFFFLGQHPQCHNAYVMCFNRDEKVDRPTLPFAAFQEDPNIFAGRDLISKGTWLGVNIKTGIFVWLTNYDLPEIRVGRSRGKLVYSFLSSQFPKKASSQSLDAQIRSALIDVLAQRQQYSAFNLTVMNVRSENMFYICSELPMQEPQLLSAGRSYGLCNTDISTMWPKTAHGLKKFQTVVSKLPYLPVSEIFDKLEEICKDRTRFSENDEDESAIFVEMYKSGQLQIKRMTKSSFMCVMQKQGNCRSLLVRQITYEENGEENRVELSLKIEENA